MIWFNIKMNQSISNKYIIRFAIHLYVLNSQNFFIVNTDLLKIYFHSYTKNVFFNIIWIIWNILSTLYIKTIITTTKINLKTNLTRKLSSKTTRNLSKHQLTNSPALINTIRRTPQKH